MDFFYIMGFLHNAVKIFLGYFVIEKKIEGKNEEVKTPKNKILKQKLYMKSGQTVFWEFFFFLVLFVLWEFHATPKVRVSIGFFFFEILYFLPYFYMNLPLFFSLSGERDKNAQFTCKKVFLLFFSFLVFSLEECQAMRMIYSAIFKGRFLEKKMLARN